LCWCFVIDSRMQLDDFGCVNPISRRWRTWETKPNSTHVHWICCGAGGSEAATFSPNKYNKSNVDFAGGGGGGARSPILTQIWVRDFSYSDAREKVQKAWAPLVPPSMASPAAYYSVQVRDTTDRNGRGKKRPSLASPPPLHSVPFNWYASHENVVENELLRSTVMLHALWEWHSLTCNFQKPVELPTRPSTPKLLTIMCVPMSSINRNWYFVAKHHTVISRSGLRSGALLSFF